LLLVLLAQLLGTGVCLTHIDTLGRRTLLLWGCALMGLAWLCAAVCVYIATLPQEQRLFYNDDDRSHYLAVSSVYLTQFFFGCALCVYAFSFALSLGTVTWVFCSEVFPYRTRAKAASASMACYYLSSMFNTSLYTLCVAGIGIWGQYNHENEVSVVAAPTAEGYWHGRNSFHYTLDVISAADISDGYLEALLGHSKHHQGHHHGMPVNNPVSVDVTVISADNSATLYLLKLASVSLILGLFVYLFFPETKGTVFGNWSRFAPRRCRVRFADN
jgi:MFS family permease